jgi:hypothetical protein
LIVYIIYITKVLSDAVEPHATHTQVKRAVRTMLLCHNNPSNALHTLPSHVVLLILTHCDW